MLLKKTSWHYTEEKECKGLVFPPIANKLNEQSQWLLILSVSSPQHTLSLCHNSSYIDLYYRVCFYM